ncbi:MAG TPA: pyridoxamine 5'-phosphate oxidase family protein [Anaeromyxobacteraceae bacterium]|nr:pyridoxamine 5'-phosphate oxidase family protein [Anaeromyxobacteraceae bacterium]
MLTREIIDFANENRSCFLATCEGDQPHVRGLLLWRADETGFYFHTGSTKSLPKQLAANPRVEIAFWAPSATGGRMMRVQGRARLLDAAAHAPRLLAERPWLGAVQAGLPGSELVVFVVDEGEVHEWSMAVNGREAAQPRVRF